MPPCPLDRLSLPRSRKYLLLLVCFGPFVGVHRCGFLCVRVSRLHLSALACQWTKNPAEYWDLLSKAVHSNGERRLFLHVFEQSWPTLHVPVSFPSDLGRGPSFFALPTFFSSTPASHCFAVCLPRTLIRMYFVF